MEIEWRACATKAKPNTNNDLRFMVSADSTITKGWKWTHGGLVGSGEKKIICKKTRKRIRRSVRSQGGVVARKANENWLTVCKKKVTRDRIRPKDIILCAKDRHEERRQTRSSQEE